MFSLNKDLPWGSRRPSSLHLLARQVSRINTQTSPTLPTAQHALRSVHAFLLGLHWQWLCSALRRPVFSCSVWGPNLLAPALLPLCSQGRESCGPSSPQARPEKEADTNPRHPPARCQLGAQSPVLAACADAKSQADRAGELRHSRAAWTSEYSSFSSAATQRARASGHPRKGHGHCPQAENTHSRLKWSGCDLYKSLQVTENKERRENEPSAGQRATSVPATGPRVGALQILTKSSLGRL